jgi:hypothetical protein
MKSVFALINILLLIIDLAAELFISRGARG